MNKLFIVIILVVGTVCAAFAASGDKPNQTVVPFQTIANSNALACNKGEVRMDASYTYNCYSSNKWKRASNGSTF